MSDFIQTKKKDLILIIAVLIIASAGMLINHLLHQKPASLLEVQVDGQVVATYDLSKNLDTIIEGAGGGTNHLIIQNGMAWISEASCPDKVCVNQGKVQLNGQIIVCLPNRMTAQVITQEK